MKPEALQIVDEYIKAYSIYYAANTLSIYYGCILRALCLLPSDIDELSKIRNSHIVEIIILLGKELSNNTVRLYINALDSFFSYCVDEGYLLKNPARNIKRPRNDREIPFVLCEESIFKLREITKHSLRDRALIEVLLSAGLRVSELCSLHKESFLVSTNQLYIEGKGARDRLVLLNDETLARLKLYANERTDDDNHLFISARMRGFSTRSINWLIHDYAKRANLSTSISPHMFRRTFATVLYSEGFELEYIRKLMGHESIDTTLLYTQIKNIKYI